MNMTIDSIHTEVESKVAHSAKDIISNILNNLDIPQHTYKRKTNRHSLNRLTGFDSVYTKLQNYQKDFDRYTHAFRYIQRELNGFYPNGIIKTCTYSFLTEEEEIEFEKKLIRLESHLEYLKDRINILQSYVSLGPTEEMRKFRNDYPICY